MSYRLALVLAAAVALTASAALAQTTTSPLANPRPAPPTPVAPVIVQAAPTTPKVIEKQSHDFVQSYTFTGNPELDQIVRWRDPICAKVIGLIDREDEAIEKRIGEVAKALDLHVGKPNCYANVEVVFTDRPQEVMDTLYQRREYMLGYYHRHDGVRLKKVTRPVQAWHVTATLGVPGQGGGSIHSEVIDDPENVPPGTCGISHNFNSCIQGVLKNVFIVVDNKQLGDKDLGAVMDYLVMMALAEPKSLDGCNELPSVIDLYAKSGCPGREMPDGLTPADASYLTALYSADPEQRSWVEQEDIAGRMAKILVNANKADRKAGG
jgi:hypothetical protein